MKLTFDFYQRPDVTLVARELLGKLLVTNVNGEHTSGIIVETEAYSYREKACHAYNERRTKRTEVLFADAGTAYVYLCYGIHSLFNVVTNKIDVAEAVLIRAVEPKENIEAMMCRRNMKELKTSLTNGPGKLSKAMGIDQSYNSRSLLKSDIWIEDIGVSYHSNEIISDARIGVGYAQEDALLPWRFSVKESIWVSKGNNKYKII